MKYFVTFLMIFFFASTLQAQTAISGIITDSRNKPIPAASITLKSGEGNITTYTRSNEKGHYTLKLPIASRDLQIEVSSLGFGKQIIPLSTQIIYNFVLKDVSIDLPTVFIKNRPSLKLNGDTLSYNLSDFSGKQDRVLADVLKKMPGIEVSSSGKISYNGKNISNFYIDGDNLLDDKYNIATKTIPKDIVDKVQVIENDQPIKMLRNKVNSEDIALNITLKDEAKLKMIGKIAAGAGVPEKFDIDANGMLFNKKYKGINYLKGNNMGTDPAQDLVSHNFSDYLKRLDNNKPDAFLSSGAAGVPDLPQNRYLFNQAGLLNVNNLFNLKKDIQLKTNVYYLRDRQTMDYSKYTEIYLPTGNINYMESQHNISYPDLLHAQANLNINRQNSYLNNVFITGYNPVKYNVSLISNEIPLRQRLNQRQFDISNELNYMNTLRSGIIYNFYSYLNYFNRPEQLQLTPGLNDTQFNNGIPYASLEQNVRLPSWFAHHYMAIKHASTTLTQSYKAGLSFQSQQLISSLDAIQNDQTRIETNVKASNDLHWNRLNLYGSADYDYKSEDERIKVTIGIPLSYQNISYTDHAYEQDKKLEKLFLNPSANFRYQTSIENFLSLSYGLKNSLGGIDDVYQGAILKNYRSLFSNNAPVTESRSHNIALGFNYRKAITMFFFSIQAAYSNVHLNTISSSIISDSLQQRIVLPFGNYINTYNLSANTSKYLFALRTTLSLGISWSQNESNQIQNGELLPYKSDNTGFKAGIQSKINNDISFNYTANYNLVKTKTYISTKGDIRYNQLRQQAELSFNLSTNLFSSIAADHLFTHQSGQQNLSYIFSDLTFRYKATKINTDFEIGINNLRNIKTYKAVYLSANTYTSATYQIPGRTGIFRVTFNF
ncbi:hypothetical protein DBR11_20615 [Pedobacter sp. HMWF019]|uniref:carboxypeptidase-like regulatory domain-containing protein n=1 Tax=Pedobacter sp. HMWF019 TaxID=2056856 RepID=UPI000D342315|nr:carboxypeptidase-like regulatory domain-containing protein [Pedobacter sp. HMWF019]PTS95811.1 hypothetical protein DBR11_20615 [Pedobacter sp. HMWF019]